MTLILENMTIEQYEIAYILIFDTHAPNCENEFGCGDILLEIEFDNKNELLEVVENLRFLNFTLTVK